MLAELGALETQLHSTWAQMLSVVAEIDSRSLAPGLGYGTTVELVRAIARVPRSEARARISAAADVLPGRRPDDTPETRRSLRFHDQDGGYELTGWLDREAAEILRSALSPLAAPRPTTETEVDLRTAAQRDADALVELAARALNDGALPTEGGERPQVVVTVSLPVLQGRIGSASLALGGPINADIARRIACDAAIIPAVLGSRGEPLDVGRASRTVPAAIRRAVILRDGGCAFPGCSVPARWCDIHHIVHWVDHGPTCLENCVALCGRHHRLLHHSHWRIEMVDGIPVFHPPPWLGGPPRTNPLYTIPDLIRIRQ